MGMEWKEEVKERRGEGKQDRRGKVKVDFQQVAYRYAMAVFMELAYDTQISQSPSLLNLKPNSNSNSSSNPNFDTRKQQSTPNSSSGSGSFTGSFDRAAITSEHRFVNPFYKITEYLLPYGRRFRRDVEDVKLFGRGIVGERRKRMEVEAEGFGLEERGGGGDGLREKVEAGRGSEEGGKDAEEDREGEGEGKGALLKELVQEFGRKEDDAFLADACLNFLTAGE